MTDGRADGIEQAFARSEAEADAALKAANAMVATLKRYRNAARQGKVRDLNLAAEAAKQGVQTLDLAVESLGESWEFDDEGYLESGEFGRELIDRARGVGLRISELDNRLYCYPALLRVVPGDRAVMIDKTRERRLRPSVLVDLLQTVQKRPPRFRSEAFLASLHTAYEVALTRKEGRQAGAVVSLGELYELLTMLPGQARDYTRQEFARDVYLLDQSGETAIKGGDRIEFHAGAGARLPKGALSVVTQQGTEKKYHGISFGPAGSDG